MDFKAAVPDVLGVAGIVTIASGVYLNFGLGWGLIAAGVALVALAMAAR